jgi:putative protein kinase ArgK-like GTPase of G3E family
MKKDSNELDKKRGEQNKKFMWKQIFEEIMIRLKNEPKIQELISENLIKVSNNELSPKLASKQILDKFLNI